MKNSKKFTTIALAAALNGMMAGASIADSHEGHKGHAADAIKKEADKHTCNSTMKEGKEKMDDAHNDAVHKKENMHKEAEEDIKLGKKAVKDMKEEGSGCGGKSGCGGGH